MQRFTAFVLTFFALTLAVYVLSTASSFFIPLVIATWFAMKTIIAIPLNLYIISKISNGMHNYLIASYQSRGYSDEEASYQAQFIATITYYGLICLQLYCANRSAREWVKQRNRHQEMAEQVDDALDAVGLNPSNALSVVTNSVTTSFQSIRSTVDIEENEIVQRIDSFVIRMRRRTNQILVNHDLALLANNDLPRIENISDAEISLANNDLPRMEDLSDTEDFNNFLRMEDPSNNENPFDNNNRLRLANLSPPRVDIRHRTPLNPPENYK